MLHQMLAQGSLESLDWLVIAVYFCALIGVVWWSSKQQETSKDYFLAGRNIGWFAIGASLFASNIGSEHIVEVARTEETPGLPLISALPDGRNDLHFAVSHHLANLPAKDAAILDIRSLVSISKADYLAVPTPKAVVK